ncbi:hypothetical protein [Caldalkalibacillus salinus]|uniref:hypothetical protein n=1 Tax=Caldalkalibacillus salinus TaxID=2803787 RepID=UPI001921C7C7|nr:hypothetical protein [Caldalkalibacillus salinus]
MRETIRVWIIVTFSILVWVLQFNLITDIKASRYLKEEVEIALHDAGLQLDEYALAQGDVIYHQQRAYDAFVNSLEKNTKLNYLEPSALSFYEDSFEVVVFDILDESNTRFPVEYEHPDYFLSRIYEGPTIIAVVETYGPRYFNGVKQKIRRGASYTYYH